MEIDKNKVVTQEESGEQAPIDEVEARVEAEMRLAEGRAKEAVAQGMGDPEREREGREMQEEAERALEAERERANDEK
jgi:hypothetical protein